MTHHSSTDPAETRKRRRWSPHLLSAGNLVQTVRILSRYGGRIDARYWPRTLGWATLSLLHSPFALTERVLTSRRVRRTKLADPLVMIIGHWRSGTTNFHNYMLQDPRFGCASLLHCLAPHEFLLFGGPAHALLKRMVLPGRPMDRVAFGLSEPMSEDFALVGVTDQTHYLCYFFPRQMDQLFRETVLFDDVPQERIDQWGRTFRRLLQKVTLGCGGKPLVLKNPANTGRIRHLLREFPDMRFVFVHRDPFTVHASSCRLMERFLERWTLQSYDWREIERATLDRHAALLRRYLEDRPFIPKGQLVEVAHEQMVVRPVETLARVYRELDLGDFETVRPAMEAHAASLSDYKVNAYEFDDQTLSAVRETLSFAFDEWGRNPAGPPA